MSGDPMTNPASLENLLMIEMSRRNTDILSELVLQKPEFLDRLVEIFLRNEEPVSRRAAWVADTISEQRPELLFPYLSEIIKSLKLFCHDGLKRHSLRIINRSPVPAGKTGELLSICFDWLLSPREAVAAKVHCMDILYRLSQSEPDLKKELADSIEWRLNEETAGFRSHGVKVLTQLYKEMK